MSLEKAHTLQAFADYAGSVGTRYSIEEGEKLYSQGEEAQSLFVVESGVIFTRRVNDVSRIMDTVSREGELIGHEAMSPESVFDGTAVAATESKVIEVSKEHILPVFIVNPEAGEDLMKAVARHITIQEGLFDRFKNKKTLEIILEATKEVSGEDGKVLVTQADQAARVGLDRKELIKWKRRYPEIPTRTILTNRNGN